MTDTEKADRAALFGKFAPVAIVSVGLAQSGWVMASAVRAVVSHPSPRARVAIGALQVSEWVVAVALVSKTRAKLKRATPEEARACRETLQPLTPVSFLSPAANAVSVYLVASPRVGRVGAAARAAGTYGVSMATLFASRALHPRMVEALRKLEKANARKAAKS